MAWGEVDATDTAYGGLSSAPTADPLANADALREAYKDAVQRQVALYIPAGTYRLQLRQGRYELSHVIALNGFWDGTKNPDGSWHIEYGQQTTPIIGAGSSLTRLEFVYPSGEPTKKGSPPIWNDWYGLWMSSTAFGPARVEGITLALADWVGGPRDAAGLSDGTDAPKTFGVFLAKSASLIMIDVATTGWHTAVGAVGTSPDSVTLYLERCHIGSRGYRVTAGAGGMTLVDCTIEHDEDGFTFGNGSFWVGVYGGVDTQLTILGGASLRSKGVYAIHGQHLKSAVIKDHYFGPEVAVGMEVWASTGSVLVDNCTFECGSGMYIAGTYSETGTYHVSNCVFNVSDAPLGDYKHWTEEVEVHFTNCRFETSSKTYSVVGRYFGEYSRPWYFSNCHFETLPATELIDGVVQETGGFGLINVVEGVLIFRACRFVSRLPPKWYAISHQHGRLELYDCEIEAVGICSFSSLSYQHVYDSAGTTYLYTTGRYTDEIITRSLTIVLEGCRVSNLQMYFRPFNPIFVRGRDNDFGNSRMEMDIPYPYTAWFAGTRRNQDLEPLDEASVDISRLVSDLQFRRATGYIKFVIPEELGTPYHSLAHHQIGLNGDFISVEGSPIAKAPIFFPRNTIASIFLPQNRPKARVEDGTANCGVGGTIQLHAIDDFTLTEGGLAGGEILLGKSASVVVARGSVATLRYATVFRAWVLISVS